MPGRCRRYSFAGADALAPPASAGFEAQSRRTNAKTPRRQENEKVQDGDFSLFSPVFPWRLGVLAFITTLEFIIAYLSSILPARPPSCSFPGGRRRRPAWIERLRGRGCRRRP